MLLTITNSQSSADDLSYLLHKHPDRLQTFSTSFGSAHVFYPVSTATCCSAAVLLDVDPIGLIRSRKGKGAPTFALQQYVNDRPYVISSFMSVTLSKVLGSALSGRCERRPELVEKPLALRVELSVLPCRGGESFLRSLFEPLGYTVEAERLPLDERFADWGLSSYYRVVLSRHCPLHEFLSHLYVLIPVLDDEKHYWVSDDEVGKLLRKGETWLAEHPQKEIITRRYLRYQPRLMKRALTELGELDSADEAQAAGDRAESRLEQPLRLNDLRYETVLEQVKESQPRSVVDFGCGEGKLLKQLLSVKNLDRVVGVDVSVRALEVAASRLRLDRLPERQRQRIALLHGSLMYRDTRLDGFDVGCLVEVIEHLDPARLAALERVVFECARPTRVIVTTPNVEYNALFPTLEAGRFRHADHRFEWSRVEFQSWASGIGNRFGYRVAFGGVGKVDADLGWPTQMGVFDRED